MAIQWGSWAGTSPRRMRVGVDFTSVPAPKSSDTAVTVSATIYVGVEYGVNDQSNTLSWSGTLGSDSGSRPFNLSSNSSRSLQSLSRAVPVSTSPTAVSVTAQLSGVEYVGATARVTATATIPAKPQNPPGQPGAVTMSRISDTSHKISWGASSGAVTRYRLEIYNASTGGWALLGHTTATAWTTGTTKPNSGYRARVRAEGPGGVSAYTTQATVAYTTPAAPTGVSAERSGSSIEVSWTDRSPFNDQFKVYASASGGAYTLLATVPNGTGEHTHANPDPTKVWRYQVESIRQASTSGVGVQLTSARATSNEVRLLSPPLAPTLVTPVGSVLDPAKGPVTFVWTHRTADSSKQTAYELQYRVDGGAWVPFSGTTASSRALDLADTGEYEWQVRTKGAHATFGPWSTVGWFTAADSPVVSITEPVDGAVLTGNRVTARWTPDILTGVQQLRFVAELQDEAGATLERAVVEDPVAASRAFSYNLLDNATYQVVVTVTDTNGLVSEPATVTFTTSFLLPAPPTLTASWSDSDASVALAPTAGAATANTVGTDTLSVERSTDGGETWETIADGLSSDAGVGDPYPPLFGPLHYRAVAVSLLPSVAYGDAVEVTPPEPTRVWLTTESGAALSLPYDLAVPSSHTPGVELHRVLGRTRPVAAFSLDYEPALSVDVSGVTLPQQGEPGEEVWAATVLGQHVYYRDPAGRRFWGAIDGALSWKPTWWGHDSVSFNVTAVDHD